MRFTDRFLLEFKTGDIGTLRNGIKQIVQDNQFYFVKAYVVNGCLGFSLFYCDELDNTPFNRSDLK